MDINVTLTVKGFPLFIEPSALKVSGKLENYRHILARFASNIWWHLNLCRPYGIKTDISAYTRQIDRKGHACIRKVFTIDEGMPTFDSVVDYCVDLFTMMLHLYEPVQIELKEGAGHLCESPWFLAIESFQHYKRFWEGHFITDDAYVELQAIKEGLKDNVFFDKSFAETIVSSMILDKQYSMANLLKK